MRNPLVIIGIIALLVGVGLSGCNENTEKNKFIGTWKEYDPTDGFTYEFFSNGTVKASREDDIPLVGLQNQFYHTWELKDGKLVITLDEGLSSTLDYHFSYNDTFLTIAPSGTIDQNFTLIKQ